MTSNILVADQGRPRRAPSSSARRATHSPPRSRNSLSIFLALAGSSTIPRIYGARRWRRFAGDSTARASGRELAGLGLTNQRETTLLWNRRTGKPIHNAIVWQDGRTADQRARLRAEGAETLVSERSGLLIDPYFSATKIAWLLDNVADARTQAERGELAFGTVDSFLLGG